MSVTIQPVSAPSPGEVDLPDVPIYRLSVAQYRAMVGAGILEEDAPVEPLEGWLVQKMTKTRLTSRRPACCGRPSAPGPPRDGWLTRGPRLPPRTASPSPISS